MAEEVSREAERHERHRKEVLEDAFNHLGKSPSHGKVILLTKDGADISINLDLLMLFSPFLRSLLSSLSRDSYQVDAIPVLILPPDISADVVLKINSLLMNGEAKFRNSSETRDVLEAAELLGIEELKTLHREDGRLFATTPPRSKKGKRGFASNSSSLIIAATSSIKKEKTIEIDEESQDVTQPLAVTYEGFDQSVNFTNGNVSSSSSVVAVYSSADVPGTDVYYPCNICTSRKKYEKVPQLYSHYIGTHFSDEISSFIKDDKCSINNCGKSYPKKGKLELHIGIHHRKILEILNREGIQVQSMTVTKPNSDNLMDPYVFVPSPKKATKGRVANPVDASTPSTPKSAGTKSSPIKSSTKKTGKSPTEARKAMKGPQCQKASGKGTTPRKKASPSLASKKLATSPNVSVNNVNNVPSSEDNYVVAKIPEDALYATPNRESQSRKRKMSGSAEKVNYELKCEVCGQPCKNPMLLEQHMVKHFLREVESRVSKFIAGEAPRLECSMCGDVFKQRNGAIVHLGSKHGFINDILKEKQLSVLPVTVNNSGYSAAKQKQLCKIKTERADYDDRPTTPNEDIRKELMLEADNNDGADQEKVNVTMEEIFEKYKEHIN